MMMKKKNLQILLICGVLLVTACKSKSKEEQQSGYRMEGDTVQITDRFLSEKIKVTEARLEPYSKEVITSGVVCLHCFPFCRKSYKIVYTNRTTGKPENPFV